MGENYRKSNFLLSMKKGCLKSGLIKDDMGLLHNKILNIGREDILLLDVGGKVAVVAMLSLASGSQTFGFHEPIKYK